MEYTLVVMDGVTGPVLTEFDCPDLGSLAGVFETLCDRHGNDARLAFSIVNRETGR